MTKQELQKVVELFPKDLGEKLVFLVGEREKLEKTMAGLRARLVKVNDKIVMQIYVRARTKIDPAKCPHPSSETTRTGAGGYFCEICGKMVDMD